MCYMYMYYILGIYFLGLYIGKTQQEQCITCICIIYWESISWDYTLVRHSKSNVLHVYILIETL